MRKCPEEQRKDSLTGTMNLVPASFVTENGYFIYSESPLVTFFRTRLVVLIIETHCLCVFMYNFIFFNPGHQFRPLCIPLRQTPTSLGDCRPRITFINYFLL